MICPACKEEMIVVEYQKIELDICVVCSGVWFDANELDLLLGSLKLGIEDLVRPLPGKPKEAAKRCPYCRSRMEKVLMGRGEGVVIDRCRNQHGLWFDGGELDTVIDSLQPGDDAAGSPKHKARGKVGSFLKDVLLAGDEDKGEKP